MLKIKRVYAAPEPEDGYRILVDRLWPRGLTKSAAKLDEWLKDISPSPELRKWFSHQDERWEAFVERYLEELRQPERASHLDRLIDLARSRAVTLLYASREERHNSATVVRDAVEARLKPRPRSGSKASR